MRSTIFVAFFGLASILSGCGGARAGEPQGGTTTGATSGEASGDPTDGGNRRAEQGARCDFGGIADMTCHRGLSCCYGPPENPGDYGTCLAQCAN